MLFRSKHLASALPPPPEIVSNVQGSSAGAGSGEFHVYKASRRREYERLKLMDEEAQKVRLSVPRLRSHRANQTGRPADAGS